MKGVELLAFTCPDDLAQAAAKDWLAQMQTARPANQPYGVALSGGRIARRFFTLTAELARRQPFDWKPVHFFWADERCVPPQDPESNFGLAHECFLQPLKIAFENIHRIRGEIPPAQAANDASAELRRFAPQDGAGIPLLDLILLGMGEDGHVASLFPGASVQGTENEVYRAVIGPKPPPDRITLTHKVISVARAVWVLASGMGKEAALRASLEGRSEIPLGRVFRARAHTRLYTDIRLP